MAGNIEIKAALTAGQPERIRSLALERLTAPSAQLDQTDTFYQAASGRLKLRVFGGGSGELIAYDRPDQPGPKHSDYVRVSVADPAALHEALARSLGIRGVVRKRRELILIGPTRVHLDQVEGLGDFLELEVVLREGQDHAEGEAMAAELMTLFDITPGQLVEGAYIDLLVNEAAQES